jgi:predicted metal-binding protein
MKKYLETAKKLGMLNAVLISPDDVFFDIRADLKCRWGCEDYFTRSIRCDIRGTSFDDRVKMARSYGKILLLHSNSSRDVSRAVLEIEREAFMDGYYFAFGIKSCALCEKCALSDGKPCPTPEKIRPCDQAFGIDVYRTATEQGLPCRVLHDKSELQNRYGFVMID